MMRTVTLGAIILLGTTAPVAAQDARPSQPTRDETAAGAAGEPPAAERRGRRRPRPVQTQNGRPLTTAKALAPLKELGPVRRDPPEEEVERLPTPPPPPK